MNKTFQLSSASIFAAAAFCVALSTASTPTHAQLGSLGSLGGDKKSDSKAESKPAAGGDVLAQQDALIKGYVGADKTILKGQAAMAEALGLKERAATLAATADALGNGATKGNLEEADKALSDANEEMVAKMKSNPELDKRAKAKYAEGLKLTGKGVQSYLGLKKNFDAFKDALQTASPTVLPKLDGGSYIVRSFPSNSKNLVQTVSTASEFAKSQRIAVPKEATSVL